MWCNARIALFFTPPPHLSARTRSSDKGTCDEPSRSSRGDEAQLKKIGIPRERLSIFMRVDDGYFRGEICNSRSAIVRGGIGSRSPSLALRSIVSAIDWILELTGCGRVEIAPSKARCIRLSRSGEALAKLYIGSRF